MQASIGGSSPQGFGGGGVTSPRGPSSTATPHAAAGGKATGSTATAVGGVVPPKAHTAQFYSQHYNYREIDFLQFPPAIMDSPVAVDADQHDGRHSQGKVEHNLASHHYSPSSARNNAANTSPASQPQVLRGTNDHRPAASPSYPLSSFDPARFARMSHLRHTERDDGHVCKLPPGGSVGKCSITAGCMSENTSIRMKLWASPFSMTAATFARAANHSGSSDEHQHRPSSCYRECYLCHSRVAASLRFEYLAPRIFYTLQTLTPQQLQPWHHQNDDGSTRGDTAGDGNEEDIDSGNHHHIHHVPAPSPAAAEKHTIKLVGGRRSVEPVIKKDGDDRLSADTNWSRGVTATDGGKQQQTVPSGGIAACTAGADGNHRRRRRLPLRDRSRRNSKPSSGSSGNSTESNGSSHHSDTSEERRSDGRKLLSNTNQPSASATSKMNTSLLATPKSTKAKNIRSPAKTPTSATGEDSASRPPDHHDALNAHNHRLLNNLSRGSSSSATPKKSMTMPGATVRSTRPKGGSIVGKKGIRNETQTPHHFNAYNSNASNKTIAKNNDHKQASDDDQTKTDESTTEVYPALESTASTNTNCTLYLLSLRDDLFPSLALALEATMIKLLLLYGEKKDIFFFPHENTTGRTHEHASISRPNSELIDSTSPCSSFSAPTAEDRWIQRRWVRMTTKRASNGTAQHHDHDESLVAQHTGSCDATLLGESGCTNRHERASSPPPARAATAAPNQTKSASAHGIGRTGGSLNAGFPKPVYNEHDAFTHVIDSICADSAYNYGLAYSASPNMEGQSACSRTSAGFAAATTSVAANQNNTSLRNLINAANGLTASMSRSTMDASSSTLYGQTQQAHRLSPRSTATSHPSPPSSPSSSGIGPKSQNAIHNPAQRNAANNGSSDIHATEASHPNQAIQQPRSRSHSTMSSIYSSSSTSMPNTSSPLNVGATSTAAAPTLGACRLSTGSAALGGSQMRRLKPINAQNRWLAVRLLARELKLLALERNSTMWSAHTCSHDGLQYLQPHDSRQSQKHPRRAATASYFTSSSAPSYHALFGSDGRSARHQRDGGKGNGGNHYHYDYQVNHLSTAAADAEQDQYYSSDDEDGDASMRYSSPDRNNSNCE